MSEDLMPSGKPVKYAIEVSSGYCEWLGINEGDIMIYIVTKL